MLWWALDEIRIQVTGRSARYSQVVLELAWNPGPGADDLLAAQLLAVGVAKRAELWRPIGSVVLVAPGARGHPGVEPAVDTVQGLWPAAEVRVVDEAVAALAGTGPDPEPATCVVVHQDAVHTSVAVVAGREAVVGGLVVGGARGLAEAVIGHVRDAHRLDVGLEMAWSGVVHGGAFAPSPTVPNPRPLLGALITENGRLLQESGKVSLSPTELRAVVAPAYRPVADLVAQVVRDAPPETAREAADGGLLLTGTHPPGAEHHLRNLTGLPARRVAEENAGFHQPRILRDGVARLLAEKPPTPDIAEVSPERIAHLVGLLEKLGLPLSRDPNADER
ncbi:rod shape-determining protein [Streptomyces sp. NPDC101776]|uniref:rod shape-determining protein n=1 Tax=Streptomyces sp. NPDC101776 TaxID=3366146 RepID=UPI0037F1CCAD